jgi:hypothetical protein
MLTDIVHSLLGRGRTVMILQVQRELELRDAVGELHQPCQPCSCTELYSAGLRQKFALPEAPG